MNIYDILGLNPPKYKLADFETNLQVHYIVTFATDIVLAIAIIIFAIVSKYWTAVIVFLAILIIMLAIHAYGLFQLLGGQVVGFDGECKVINKTKPDSKLKQHFLGSKSSIEIKYEDTTYVVPVKHNSTFRKGSIIRVYFLEGELYKKDEDTYTIPNPIYISKIKNSDIIDKDE